jgi:hypothetical protein
MTLQAKYVHTNLIAADWRALADFYQRVFGCTPVPPERDLKGAALEAGTGIPGATIRGMHLRLPGYGDNGPTVEFFNTTNWPIDQQRRSIGRAGDISRLRWKMWLPLAPRC